MPSMPIAEDERNVQVRELVDGFHGASHGRRHGRVGGFLHHDLALLHRLPVAGALLERDGDVRRLQRHRSERGARDERVVGRHELVDGAAGHLQRLGRRQRAMTVRRVSSSYRLRSGHGSPRGATATNGSADRAARTGRRCGSAIAARTATCENSSLSSAVKRRRNASRRDRARR